MQLSRTLQLELDKLIASIHGTVGVVASHSRKGLLYECKSQEVFPLASTYKIPILITFLKKVEDENLDLDEKVEIQPEDIPEGSAILDRRHFSYPGVSLSLRNLVRLMIEYSDNTASDLILKLTGGAPAVMDFLQKNNFKNMRVDRSTARILSEGLTSDKDSGTPQAMLELLSQMLDHKLLGEVARQFLIDCMYRCKTGNARIRGLLPPGTPVGNKTGSAAGFVNDLGFVDLPSSQGQLRLAVYIKGTTVPLRQSEQDIAQISKLLYDHAVSAA